MFNLFRKKTKQEPGHSNIVPRIKHTNMLAFVREQGIPEQEWPVTEPLVADLLISYAFDLPHAFQMITSSDLKRLNLTPEDLRRLAVKNLRRQVREIKTEGQGSPVLMLTAGQDLTACLLLLDEVWEDLAGQLPGETVVAAPSRGIILVTSSDWQDGLALIRELVAGVLERESTHRLSDVLLVRRQNTWSNFETTA